MIGKKHEYDAMAACEQQLWWYRCLHDFTLSRIKKNCAYSDPLILDAGCGTGGLLRTLKENGYSSIAGFDLSPDAVSYAKANSAVDVRMLDITGMAAAYPANNFDIVVSHDILCLLQPGQDQVGLSQLLAVVKPGGLLLLNFPALKAFNGTHDTAVGIQRRYSVKVLQQLVGNSANIKEITFWPFFLSPPIFLTRKLQKLKSIFNSSKKPIVSDVKMPPQWLNSFFYRLTSYENRKIPAKPWGSSIFLVLQKPF